MDQNVPRRLQRFYRAQGNKPAEAPKRTNYYDQPFQSMGEEAESANGREILKKIPGMDYEDLKPDSKNAEDIKKIEQRNLESKLALQEIEKFKKENKRMPTKEEADQIAENLYLQFKDEDTSKLYEGIAPEEKTKSTETSQRHGRHSRDAQKNSGELPAEEETRKNNLSADSASSETMDIKSLLENNPEKKIKKEQADEFDLGLNESGEETSEINLEEDAESIEDLSFGENENCPNCKKPAEKIIYCPKCGAAFCANCAQKQGKDSFCPKCKNKIKA